MQVNVATVYLPPEFDDYMRHELDAGRHERITDAERSAFVAGVLSALTRLAGFAAVTYQLERLNTKVGET